MLLKDWDAQEIMSEVHCNGLWWADEECEEIVGIEMNMGHRLELASANENCLFVEMADGSIKKVNATTIRAGLAEFIKEYPNAAIVDDIRSGNMDAEIAGVAAQYAILGELVYG